MIYYFHDAAGKGWGFAGYLKSEASNLTAEQLAKVARLVELIQTAQRQGGRK